MAVDSARDHTQDWILPADRRPRSFAELEGKIDTAVAVARSAEAAALAIGDAAIEAAEQARRAAEMAETAAIRAAGGSADPAPSGGDGPAGGVPAPAIADSVAPTPSAFAATQDRYDPPTPLPPGDEDDGDHDFAPPRPGALRAKAVSLPDLDQRLRAFTERASQVSMRLVALGNSEAGSGGSGSPGAVVF